LVYLERAASGKPEFTICIPVYQHSDLLARTLENIRNSHFKAVASIDLVVSIEKQSVVQNRLDCLKHTNTDLVLWLDDDIEFQSAGWDLYLLYQMNSHKDIGALGINCVNYTANSLKSDRTHGDVLDVCGAVMFTRRIDNVEFDPIYQGSQWEDTDYCYQVRRAGYRVVQNNGVYAIHYTQTRNASNNNAAIFHAKWSKLGK
jgi:hypothetical protein